METEVVRCPRAGMALSEATNLLMWSDRKGLKAREVQGVPETQSAQFEPIMSTGVAQAATDTGLAQRDRR